MKGIRIRPEQQGIRTALFDLEADIMEIVWARGWQEFSVADVHRELERDRAIAYTTVMTTISRLHDKELLGRRRDGRRYLYTPHLSREGFARAMAREVLDCLPEVGQREAVALLVERVQRADTKELDRLEALIRARREELDP